MTYSKNTYKRLTRRLGRLPLLTPTYRTQSLEFLKLQVSLQASIQCSGKGAEVTGVFPLEIYNARAGTTSEGS